MDEAQAKRVAADPDLIAKSLLYFDSQLPTPKGMSLQKLS